jgi:transcriptional regulator with GAF, ATPase, and Fis domain
MARMRAVDPSPQLARVAEALARPGQPQALFEALDRAMADTLGHRLFTVLRYHPDAQESERRYTSQGAAYPIGGRKAVRPTPWTARVFGERRPYIGRTAADIRASFPDAELILSLGCESVLNLPVVFDGRVLGTVNLLHGAGWYDEDDLSLGLTFAALAVPGFLAA